MKKIILVFFATVLLISCVGNDKMILRDSIGKINKVMVVAKISDWTGDVGQEIRNTFGELQVGLQTRTNFICISSCT